MMLNVEKEEVANWGNAYTKMEIDKHDENVRIRELITQHVLLSTNIGSAQRLFIRFCFNKSIVPKQFLYNKKIYLSTNKHSDNKISNKQHDIRMTNVFLTLHEI